MAEFPTRRQINWLEHTSRSVGSKFPETRHCSQYVTSRLAALLLERLPSEIAEEMLELLPEDALGIESLRVSASIDWNPSIGFTDFVRRSETSLGVSEISEELIDRVSQEVAEAFLWAVAQEMPVEIKQLLHQALPSEIRLRMNLNTASSEDSRVA
ncbi:MAG: hypothetical protein ACXVBW_02810 [Bdellovibrionota bacterium]